MKRYISTFALFITVSLTSAQKYNSNLILVRRDTVLLNAEECEWFIRPFAEKDPATSRANGKTVTQLIMESIEKGKIKAADPLTQKIIPGKDIYKWKMPVDSIPAMDSKPNHTRVTPIQRLRNADQISRIRVFNNWYFDVLSGKFQSLVQRVELMEEIHDAAGNGMGYSILCRIDY